MLNVTESPDGYPIYTTPQGIVYFAGGDDANCTLPECPIELSTYGYRASLPLSAVLIALYALCMVAQTWLGWKYKTWSFLAAMLLGCFTEILGYAGRIMMWENPWNNTGFIMQIGTRPLLYPHLSLTSHSPYHHRSSLLLCSNLCDDLSDVRLFFPAVDND